MHRLQKEKLCNKVLTQMEDVQSYNSIELVHLLFINILGCSKVDIFTCHTCIVAHWSDSPKYGIILLYEIFTIFSI